MKIKIKINLFSKWGRSPQHLHPKDAHGFLLDYSQNFTRTIQKITLEATSLNLQWGKGGDNTPTHIIQKTKMPSQTAQ
jgi:hypothetical protein